MRFFLTAILFLYVNGLYAQKPVIDSAAYKIWPSFSQIMPTINKNGKYVSYNIENVPLGSKTVVVQSTDGKWKKEFNGRLKDGSLGALSAKYFLFINKNDSLGMLTLGTSQIKYIPKTPWCSSLYETEGEEYLLYPSNRNPKVLLIKNLTSGKERSFTDVDSWDFEKGVLVLVKSLNGNEQKQSINFANIKSGRISKIWEGYKPENIVLDAKHRQLAFKTSDSVWYYKFDSAKAFCISDKKSFGKDSTLSVGYLESFSKDGKFLYTSLIGKRDNVEFKNGVVEIWSYTDVQLQTEQGKAATDPKYLAVIDIEENRLIRLQQQSGEQFQFLNSVDGIATVALIEHLPVVDPSDIWNTACKLSWDLVSLKNGNRKHLDFLDRNDMLTGSVKLSPSGKYLLFFDRIKHGYYSYEIASGTIRSLTEGIKVVWMNADKDDIPSSGSGRGVAAWLKNDQSVLVYDRYDIWKLDPLNVEKAVNLTNGYGKRNQVVFNFAFESDEGIINKDEKLYLTAFNKENKDNGFFLKQLDKAGDPELLHMGPYLYQTNSAYVPNGSDFTPLKATKSEMYVVRRTSATEAPNYFSTKDFKTFIRLSDLQPQKKYNWYTTELHTWKSLDGRKLQGVLYKPENFDPNKKYPVIFYYYERKSDGLNVFLRPNLLGEGSGTINIPTYVSNGYLVFSPDIYYKVGDPMQGTCDAIVSANDYLSTLPFVNDKKIGLQGNSFGGLQTNYIITHTARFAAAVSSSGLSNMVSAYGDIYPDEVFGGDSMEKFFESGQIRMGKTFWEIPESYIKNSPIFNVHMVTSPILIMHTKKDGSAASYKDAQQFFTGLRRMGKKAWMLAYSEGNHGVSGKEADDFSIRMMQFFDHYLKDKPAPLWMLDGVAAKNRSWEAGLELDTKGRTPGPGLLTPEEQQKVEAMMKRKPINITLK